MSWKDNYTRDLIITTGDGETFTCYTLPSFTKEVEFATTEFNFINIDQQLVKKTIIQGTDIPLEFFFINDNHIEETKSFLFSAADPNPWTITHPYYETLLIQPVGKIKINDVDGNITGISFNARVTISDGESAPVTSVVDSIILKQSQIQTQLAVEPDLTPTITDIHALQAMTTKNYKNSVKIITDPIDTTNYFNAFNTASSYINTITATPLAAINALTSVISEPAQFASSVQNRVRVLTEAMVNLHNTVFGLLSVTQKKLFFTQSCSTMCAICATAVQPASGNYKNAGSAITIAQGIKTTYTTFLSDIDTIQGANGGNPLSYFPPFDVMVQLNQLVNTTVSNLFDIALAGRKEFSYTLPENSDYLLLTHRFYGLDVNDNNINDFIDNNALIYTEVALGLPKGKTVVYYA